MIQMDFRADLIAHIDAELQELGYSPDAAGDARQNPPRYLMLLIRLLRRVPAAVPRRIIVAPEFSVPPKHAVGYGQLIRAIEDGASLKPWLSRKVRKLKELDSLLDDWGIHHFHLGQMQPQRRAAFVERTDEVAFAVVQPDAVYFLTATGHDPVTVPHVWTASELIEIVHRHWPSLLARSRIHGEGQHLTEEERTGLRKHRTNATVRMADGTAYYSPGGGMMSDGDGALDFIYQLQLMRAIEALEDDTRQSIPQIRARLSMSDDQPIMLKARFTTRFPQGFTIDVVEPTSGTLIIPTHHG